MSRFVELLRQYQRVPFVAHQLLLLSRHLDMADEAGRRMLTELLRSMLPNDQVPLELLEPTLLLLRDVVQRRDDYIRLGVESIAEMREPVSVELHVSFLNFCFINVVLHCMLARFRISASSVA
jgi:hypothetical protein